MADGHVPVLLGPLLRTVAPVRGRWLDGTFGAGGYARGLLDAGADQVIGVDRDPKRSPPRRGRRRTLALHSWRERFGELDEHAGGPLDGVVLDLGVSSMQLDQAERGFSFRRDGPLDMRMGGDGPSAADLVNSSVKATLADILFRYGEERASRRIARAIVSARPIETTSELAAVSSSAVCRGRSRAKAIRPRAAFRPSASP